MGKNQKKEEKEFLKIALLCTSAPYKESNHKALRISTSKK